jgi:hypothetical protein
MENVLIHFSKLIIPMMALSIPIIAVTSRTIVQPLVKALTRLADHQQGRGERTTDQRTLELEKRIASLEGTLERILEEQEFQRELLRGAANGTARLGETATPRPLSHG